jgi:hypothetical protein
LREIRQSRPTDGEDRLIPFLASLVAEDLSPKTVDGSARTSWPFAAGIGKRGEPTSAGKSSGRTT